ncbi:16S rRNA (uracil(1498)-N(3))-methyltransferase [Saccharospirillum salsuginis]|uniref:Ribosomal RNA small subunit methyltransferase E n=1 Tax=Saccharospirillum salsuginis TaxID=418750 RepID=A0A918K6K3_9GAMM|nr:16S rRNA (uracil(1498)-N(3))-methyltransferase [Saccharospirillum salsuginis]GGX49972.1 ribosomal RNA small subunit methyltransferase E [Saccharospirillum salsuginis]
MRVPRIHLPDAEAPGQRLALPESAFGHLVRVLRLGEGAPIEAFNGRGKRFVAVLADVGKRRADIQLTEALPTLSESPLHTHLGLVMSKGDRMDYALQKATELGVSRITPLTSERCDLRLKAERQAKKLQHWQGVLASACEQCGRDTVPVLDEVTGLSQWLDAQESQLRLVLHTAAQTPEFPVEAPSSVSFLVGPEGGLTDGEVEQAVRNGFQAWQLGSRILRTETAPVAMLAILQHRWGDLGVGES